MQRAVALAPFLLVLAQVPLSESRAFLRAGGRLLARDVADTTTVYGSCDLLSNAGCLCMVRDDPKPDSQQAFEWLLIALLLVLSGTFSGLNLGLLGLDLTGLEVVAEGDPDSRNARYARAILPIRKKHNWLLCSLLLGNVMTNSGISILLADKTSGLMGFIIATFAIVMLGEIFPQAVSSRYPLVVSYHSLPLVYMFMFILYPIARPMGLILDFILGAPLRTIYANEEFTHLLELHRQAGALDDDQSKIMKGAINLKNSTVADCYTPIEKLYALEMDEVLNRAKMKEIFTSGYSRIPVYSKDRRRTVGMILVKDLILVDPRQRRTVGEVAGIFERTPLFFTLEQTLDVALHLFKQGRSHCAIVEVPSGPNMDTVGMVTLEDIMEEILHSEIKDETEDPVSQRLITNDPTFVDRIVSLTKGAKSRPSGTRSEPDDSSDSSDEASFNESIMRAQRPLKLNAPRIAPLAPTKRLVRVVSDASNLLGLRLQTIVKDVAVLESLGINNSTSALPELTLTIAGTIDVGGQDKAPVPWYSTERDSYQALFTVSIFALGIPNSGISRRVVFNANDALKEAIYANDGKVPVRRANEDRGHGLGSLPHKTISDPNITSPAAAAGARMPVRSTPSSSKPPRPPNPWSSSAAAAAKVSQSSPRLSARSPSGPKGDALLALESPEDTEEEERNLSLRGRMPDSP